MLKRIPEKPPTILPIVTNERPLWSVMIPTYNCYSFLQETLLHVLEQDPGPSKMEIEVVDDQSMDGNVEELVFRIGRGRIKYFRQLENVGSLRNFETCINRASGYIIHLLHGDDYVLPGFYLEMEVLFNSFPEIGASFCRSRIFDVKGAGEHMTENISNEKGIVNHCLEKLAICNYPQPPAMVVRRSVYERLGSFWGVKYGEDWEMWCRIASEFAIAYSPECLAVYRVHESNITTESYLSGKCIGDIKKVINAINKLLPEEQQRNHRKQATRGFAEMFSNEGVVHFAQNRKQYFILLMRALIMDPNRKTTKNFIWALKYFIMQVPRYLKRKLIVRVR